MEDNVGPKRIALVIGIDDYKYYPKLKSCRTSAQAVFRLLTNPNYGLCDPQSSMLLIDENGEKLTIFKILKAVRNITNKLNPKDQFIFYFCGHAHAPRGDLYLLLNESSENDPQSDFDFVMIVRALQRGEITRAIFIVDACQSFALKNSVKNLLSAWKPTQLPKGFSFLASSSEYQFSNQLENKKLTAFSYYFCRGIFKGTHANSQFISLRDLQNYINEQITFRHPKFNQVAHSLIESDRPVWISLNSSFKPEETEYQNAIFLAPALPDTYVHRDNEFLEIKEELLSDQRSKSGVVSSTLIYGHGGCGKSTIAKVIAHDSEIKNRYSDGIFWIYLGQNPNLFTELSTWIEVIGGRRPSNLKAAVSYLRNYFQDKAALLIIDDIWQSSYVDFFQFGTGKCHLLMTARNATIGNKIGAKQFELKSMKQEEALKLFEAYTGDLSNNDRKIALELAKKAFFLPMILVLIGANVKDYGGWRNYDKFWGRRKNKDINDALEHSLKISLDWLRSEDPEIFEFCLRLSTFSNSHPFPVNAVKYLYLGDKQYQEVEIYLKRLKQRGLIEEVKELSGFHYSFHAMIYGQLLKRLGRDRFLNFQNLFIQKLKSLTNNGLWYTLQESEEYIHNHLIWHLEQAGEHEEIHNLLQFSDTNQQNAWYVKREKMGQVAGYLSDVQIAWRLAEKQYIDQPHSKHIDRILLYALISSSLSSLAERISPPLLKKLTEANYWQLDQALFYAESIPNEEKKEESFALLVPIIAKKKGLSSAKAQLRSLKSLSLRINAMISLLPDYDKAIITELKQLVKRVDFVPEQVEIFLKILSQTNQKEELAWLTFQQAQKITPVKDRLDAIGKLISQVEEFQNKIILEKIVENIREIKEPLEKLELLKEIATQLGDAEIGREVIDLAILADNPVLCVKTIITLLSDIEYECEKKAEYVELLFNSIMKADDEAIRIELLLETERVVTTEDLHVGAPNIIQSVQDPTLKTIAWKNLESRLLVSKKIEKEVIDTINSFTDRDKQNDAWLDLAPYLSNESERHILESLSKWNAELKNQEPLESSGSGNIIAALAVSSENLEKAISRLKDNLISQSSKFRALMILLRRYGNEPIILSELLPTMTKIEGPEAQKKAFYELWSKEPELLAQSYDEAIKIIRKIPDQQVKIELMLEIAKIVNNKPSENLILEAILVCHTIYEEQPLILAIQTIVFELIESKFYKEDTYRELLTVIRRMPNPSYKAILIFEISRRIDNKKFAHEMLNEALLACQAIGEIDKRNQIKELIVSELLRLNRFYEALTALRTIEDFLEKSVALKEFSNRLFELGFIQESLATIEVINWDDPLPSNWLKVCLDSNLINFQASDQSNQENLVDDNAHLFSEYDELWTDLFEHLDHEEFVELKKVFQTKIDTLLNILEPDVLVANRQKIDLLLESFSDAAQIRYLLKIASKLPTEEKEKTLNEIFDKIYSLGNISDKRSLYIDLLPLMEPQWQSKIIQEIIDSLDAFIFEGSTKITTSATGEDPVEDLSTDSKLYSEHAYLDAVQETALQLQKLGFEKHAYNLSTLLNYPSDQYELAVALGLPDHVLTKIPRANSLINISIEIANLIRSNHQSENDELNSEGKYQLPKIIWNLLKTPQKKTRIPTPVYLKDWVNKVESLERWRAYFRINTLLSLTQYSRNSIYTRFFVQGILEDLPKVLNKVSDNMILDSFSTIKSNLQLSDFDKALEIAKSIKDFQNKVAALLILFEVLPEKQRTTEVRVLFKELNNFEKGPENKNYASIKNIKINVLSKASDLVAENIRKEFLEKLLSSLKDIKDVNLVSQALINNCHHFSSDLLLDAMYIAENNIEDSNIRKEVLRHLIQELPKRSSVSVMDLLTSKRELESNSSLLKIMSKRTRKELLLDLKCLVPLLKTQEDARFLINSAKVIQKVTTWWP